MPSAPPSIAADGNPPLTAADGNPPLIAADEYEGFSQMMWRLIRYLVIAVLAAISAAAQAPRDREQTERRVSWMRAGPAVERLKREVVRDILRQQSRGADEPMFLDAVSRAGALTDIALTGSESGMILTLHTVGRPLVEIASFDDGQRLVIDLHNAINLRPNKSVSMPPGGFVRHVRASMFTIEPQFVSRVVIELVQPVLYRVGRDRDRVEIRFLPRATAQDGSGQVPMNSAELQRELDHQATRIRVARSRFEELEHRLGYQAGVIEREIRAQVRRGQLTGKTREASALESALTTVLDRRDAGREELKSRLNQETAAAEERVSFHEGRVNDLISGLRGRVTEAQTARDTLADLGSSIDMAKDRDFAQIAQIEKELWVTEQQWLKETGSSRGPLSTCAKNRRQHQNLWGYC